VDLF